MRNVLWPSTRRRRYTLWAILAVAAMLRLWLWAAFPDHQPANDEVEYLQVARDLLAGHGWRFYDAYPWLRAPLYPLWLAGSLWLFGGDAHAALLPTIALGVGQIWLCFGFARMLLNPSERAELAGLWAAGFGAVLLTFVTFANLWMSEILWSSLWTSSLMLLLRWRESPRWWLAALAGSLLGLTILTRSAPWLFIPCIVLWMAWIARRAAWKHILALIVLCILVIAPWTIRNWRAYGAPILVETGFSYNLWAFSEPPLELSEINEILSAIPNPIDRADYASAQGRALLAADPMIVARKIWPNTIYLWRIKPIEDRFLQQHYYSDVPLGYFVAALIFDDLLYIILLLAALWGLAHARRDARLALIVLWLSYIIGTTLLTHGEARYRHFFWPIMLVYAGATFARQREAAPRWQQIPAAVGAIIILFVIGSQYPWNWAVDGVQRGWYRMHALRHFEAGRLDAAEQAAMAGITHAPSPDSWIRLGQIREARGDIAGAEWAFITAINGYQTYPFASLALGAFWLEHGTPAQAQDAWNPPYSADEALLDFGWQQRIQDPKPHINFGAGLDLGLVTGVYPAEQFETTAIRWSNKQASIRLPAGAVQALFIRARNPRPELAPQAPVHICVESYCTSIQLGPEWRIIEVLAPASSSERLLMITTEPWQPQALGLGPDERQLGVMLDWIHLSDSFALK